LDAQTFLRFPRHRRRPVINSTSALLALILTVAFPSLSPVCASQTKQSSADGSIALGDWHGESICVVRESACHDEDSLYHVTKLPGTPGWFSIKLDKIVDGKPITMGTTECSYDSPKRSLTCEFPRGVLHFTIQDETMSGTMNLKDGTLWRKITLKKSAAS
jgi:hypothetical protein